jgi:hypothetical protein
VTLEPTSERDAIEAQGDEMVRISEPETSHFSLRKFLNCLQFPAFRCGNLATLRKFRVGRDADTMIRTAMEEYAMKMNLMMSVAAAALFATTAFAAAQA